MKFSFNFLFLFCSLFGYAQTQKADSIALKKYVSELTNTPTFRNIYHLQQLNAAADYLYKNFNQFSDSVRFQDYTIEGVKYRNIICSFGTENKERIIIGAHYDVCGEQAGADDNASGVAGILELARMLNGQKLNKRIDVVAYTLEEPPHFRKKSMGSYIHANYLKQNNIPVFGMVSVEMIGYFSDKKHSQHYPLPILSWVYGNKGNFITLVKKFGSGKFERSFIHHFVHSDKVKTKKFAGPKLLPGIDFSDHLNYWHFGFDALMITDTAFYRNKNYHKPTDTMEKLDFSRMAQVVDALYVSCLKLAQ